MITIIRLYYGAVCVALIVAIVYGYILYVKVMKRILKVLDFVINKKIKCDKKED